MTMELLQSTLANVKTDTLYADLLTGNKNYGFDSIYIKGDGPNRELLERIWDYKVAGQAGQIELTEQEVNQLRWLMYYRAYLVQDMAPIASSMLVKSLDQDDSPITPGTDLGQQLGLVFENTWWRQSKMKNAINNEVRSFWEDNNSLNVPSFEVGNDYNYFSNIVFERDLFLAVGSADWNVTLINPSSYSIEHPGFRKTYYESDLVIQPINDPYDFHYMEGGKRPSIDAQNNQVMFVLTTHPDIPPTLRPATYDVDFSAAVKIGNAIGTEEVALDPDDPEDQEKISNYNDFVDDLIDPCDSCECVESNCPDQFPYPPDTSIQVVNARDPNEKMGPTGPEEENLISTEQSLLYIVYFENLPDASAPAVDVIITDQIDSLLDWRKFKLGEIAFGDTTIIVPENRSYWHTTVELDSLDLLLEIDAGINAWTGEAHWYFETIDPNTGQPPVDPFAGFLPPNDSTGRGEGHVTFTIEADDNLPEGTEIVNNATIVFDINDPIITNDVVNVIYNPKPDLIVASAGIQSGSSILFTDEPAYFNAIVENQGQDDCGQFYLKMFLHNPLDSGILLDSALIDNLTESQTYDANFIWTPTENLDSGLICFVADYDDAIVEMDENNNSHTLQISVITEYICGDVNNDENVNIFDITYLISYLYMEGPPPEIMESADVNHDGARNIFDITYLIGYLYLDGPEPDCTGSGKQFAKDSRNDIGHNATITCTVSENESIISVNSPVDVFGLELTLKSSNNDLANLECVNEGLQIYSSQKESKIKLGMLDIKGRHCITKGKSEIIKVNGQIEIETALGADRSAQPVFFKINNSILPRNFILHQNYPNPFNPTTIISFGLPKSSEVNLEIYNILGRRVMTLVNGTLEAGNHTIKWNGTDSKGSSVATGVYFYRLTAGDFIKSKKMLLLK